MSDTLQNATDVYINRLCAVKKLGFDWNQATDDVVFSISEI